MVLLKNLVKSSNISKIEFPTAFTILDDLCSIILSIIINPPGIPTPKIANVKNGKWENQLRKGTGKVNSFVNISVSPKKSQIFRMDETDLIPFSRIGFKVIPIVRCMKPMNNAIPNISVIV